MEYDPVIPVPFGLQISSVGVAVRVGVDVLVDVAVAVAVGVGNTSPGLRFCCGMISFGTSVEDHLNCAIARPVLS